MAFVVVVHLKVIENIDTLFIFNDVDIFHRTNEGIGMIFLFETTQSANQTSENNEKIAKCRPTMTTTNLIDDNDVYGSGIFEFFVVFILLMLGTQ